jgi:hypothetical protein
MRSNCITGKLSNVGTTIVEKDPCKTGSLFSSTEKLESLLKLIIIIVSDEGNDSPPHPVVDFCQDHLPKI